MNEIFLNFRVREGGRILPPYTDFKHLLYLLSVLILQVGDHSQSERGSEPWSYTVGTRRYHFLQNRGDEPLSRQ